MKIKTQKELVENIIENEYDCEGLAIAAEY